MAGNMSYCCWDLTIKIASIFDVSIIWKSAKNNLVPVVVFCIQQWQQDAMNVSFEKFADAGKEGYVIM